MAQSNGYPFYTLDAQRCTAELFLCPLLFVTSQPVLSLRPPTSIADLLTRPLLRRCAVNRGKCWVEGHSGLPTNFLDSGNAASVGPQSNRIC
jgi:hypothetical protein